MRFETTADLLADRELEAGLVVALALAPGLVEQVRDELAGDDFADDALGALYAALLDGRPVAVPEAAAVADVVAAARRVAALAGGRKLAGVPPLLSQRLLALQRGDATLDDVLADFADAAARGVEAATPAQPLRPAGALVGDVLADAAARHRHRQETGNEVMGLPTGLDELDRLVGGFEPGTLTVLMARPNAGKTTLVNQWGYAIAKGGSPVLYLSFENPPADLIRKHIVRIAGVPASDVLRGRAPQDRLAQAAQVFTRDVGDRLYFVAGTAATNVGAIAAMAHRIRRRHPDAGPMLIVVDYLQKLATRPGDGPRGAGYDDLRGNVSRVSQELRDLARAVASPVLAISSVNRAAYANEKAKPSAASAKESGSIEFDSDVMLALADDDDESSPPGLLPVRLDVLKARFGPTGGVRLYFNGAQARFDPRVAAPAGRR